MTIVSYPGKCLTLIANGNTHRSTLLGSLKPLLTINHIEHRAKHVWDVYCPADTELSQELRNCLYEQRLDFALQDAVRRRKRLFLSDMDATMVVGETIDEMAQVLGIYDKISAITEAAMQGEIDYRDALKQRLALLKGISRDAIAAIAEQAPLAEGAHRLLAEINRRNMYSCLISGGFSPFTEAVAKKLGFKTHLSNLLSYDDNDCLDGSWIGDLVTAEVKEATLRTLAKKNQLELSATLAIGDGANDKLMVAAAGLGVAYYGKPTLREAAQAEIHSGSIDGVIWFL